MKLYYRWSFLFVFLCSLFGFVHGIYVDDQVIVQYKVDWFQLFSQEDLSSVVSVVDLQGESVEDAVARLSEDPDVLHVQPNYVYYTQSFAYPNDTFFSSQRWLDNIWQSLQTLWTSGLSGADISWLAAMNVWSGVDDPSVTGTVVAVIDNGVLYTHDDLQARMWDGTNCVDKDGNALWNCSHGYDYYNNDTNPIPAWSDYHGTHVAGIVGAQLNTIWSVGVNPNARIMALRAGNGNTLTTVWVINSIGFAQQNGAKIINASFGGSGNDLALRNAIDAYDGLFVAAAGNQWLNHAITAIYPCDYTISHVICVGASTQNETYASFSDYGTTSVDVVAPGEAIASTVNSGWSSAYGYLNGTSMATPFVAGLASLVWSYRPQLDRLQIRDIIFGTVDVLAQYSDKVATSGRINALAAIEYAALLTADMPDAFAFDTLTGAFPNVLYTSNIATISWLGNDVTVFVNYGQYRINGWVRSGAGQTGTISNGDTLQLALTATQMLWVADVMGVVVGGYSTTFTVVTTDPLPGPDVTISYPSWYYYDTTGFVIRFEVEENDIPYEIFGTWFTQTFTGVLQSGVNDVSVFLSGTQWFNPVSILVRESPYLTFDNAVSVLYDIQAPTLASVSLASGSTIYGTSVLITGTVTDNFAVVEIPGFSLACDYVGTDVTSCAFSGTVTVSSGDYTILFYLHDKVGNLNIVPVPIVVDLSDRTPNIFTFTAQTNIARSTVVASNTITVTGIDTGVSISVVGWQYRVNSGSYTSAAWTVFNGDAVQLQMTSSASYSAASTATLTVGTRTGAWSVTTQAAPVSPGGWPSWWPASCTPSSVVNGTVNSSTCQITCKIWYKLTGQQCLLSTIGTGSTGNLQLQDVATTPLKKTINGEEVVFLVPAFTEPRFANLSTVLMTWIAQQAAQKGVRSTKLDGVVDSFNDMMQALYRFAEFGDKTIAVTLINSFKAITSTFKNAWSVAGVSVSHKTSTSISPVQTAKTDVDDAIAFLYDKGLTSFSTSASFRPDDSMTREQAAKFVSQFIEKVKGVEPEMDPLCSFSDAVDATNTLLPYIRQLCWHGVVPGGKFRPLDVLTRAEGIAFVVRALWLSVATTDPWHNGYISTAYAQWLVSSASTAGATSPITRWDMAVLLYRAAQK